MIADDPLSLSRIENKLLFRLLDTTLLSFLLCLNLTNSLSDDMQRLVVQPAACLRVVCSIILWLLVRQDVNIGDVGQASWQPRLVVLGTV